MRSQLIRFDWATKRLLRSKANFNVLEGFLTTLLGQTITIEHVLESESNREGPLDKSNRVDVLAKNTQGELIIIEVQNNREYDFVSRILYGVSKTITEYMHITDSYRDVKKVICVSIVYFDLGQGSDYVYHGQTRFLGVHAHDELRLNEQEQLMYGDKQHVSDIYPEYYIIKVNQFDEVAKDPLDQWVHFLKTEQIKSEFTAPGLREAKEVLNVMKLSGPEKAAYEHYLENLHYEASTLGLERELGQAEGREEGLAEGLEKGKAEGRAEGLTEGLEKGKAEGLEKGKAEGLEQGRQSALLDTARRMLAEGLDKASVARMTGLTRAEIEAVPTGKTSYPKH